MVSGASICDAIVCNENVQQHATRFIAQALILWVSASIEIP